MFENNKKDIELAQKGSREALNRLISNNKGLIWNIVKRFNDRGYEPEDLYQIGCVGFLKSIKRFDISYEVKLSTYAVPYILGEIKRFIRDDGLIKVSRSTKELAVKIKTIQNEYFTQKGKEITIKELAGKLKIDKEEIALAMESSKPVESIYKEESNEDDRLVIDRISSPIDQEKKITDRLALNEIIKELNDRERQIILLRYYKEKTQMQVGKILGITQVQVSRIERKVLDRMKQKLEAVWER